jgi:V/A-type H+-transporting ATPase subunit E
MSENRARSSGVEELVERLRQEGVDEGRQEAEKLLEEARREAAAIVEEARGEAATLREEAESSNERVRAAAEKALRLAVRDALLELRNEIEDRFVAQLRRLVAGKLRDPGFLERLLLGLVGRAAPAESPVEALVPEVLPPAGETAAGESATAMDDFVRGLTEDMLRDGVTIATAEDIEAGLLLRFGDGSLELQLDEHTLTELLGHYLMPRFRSLLDGAVIEDQSHDGRD